MFGFQRRLVRDGVAEVHPNEGRLSQISHTAAMAVSSPVVPPVGGVPPWVAPLRFGSRNGEVQPAGRNPGAGRPDTAQMRQAIDQARPVRAGQSGHPEGTPAQWMTIEQTGIAP